MPHELADAVELDRSCHRAFELAELWQRLFYTCDWRARQAFETDERLYIFVESVLPRRPGKNRSALEDVLLGKMLKIVAIERGTSDSVVSLALRDLLQRVGLDYRPRAVPIIVRLALKAYRSKSGLMGRLSPCGDGSVVSVERPKFCLDMLTDAEREVFVEFLRGRSYAEIASARKTSKCTIANQVRSASKKLGVSGHSEALAKLFGVALVQ